MAEDDRHRWNERYRAGHHGAAAPSDALTELAAWLPTRGRALDVAGGAGAEAIWLAQRGLDVTLADVSEVALAIAVERALRAGVDLSVAQLDLERDPLPPGPWSVVTCCHYLQRELIPAIADALAPRGRLLWIHPTTTNLERHAKPGARWLLDPGEAESLVRGAGLRVAWVEEAWVGSGDAARHLARVVGERAPMAR